MCKVLNEVLNKIIKRIIKLLEKRGLIVKDEEDHLCLNINDNEDSLSTLQAGSVTYRFTMGPNKGKKALTLKTLQESDLKKNLGLVAKNSGFSLHAGVAMNGTDRSKIEKLCRYIARPAVALNRLSLNSTGQVIYTLKKAYDDGTTKIVMTQLELMERLAAIVPRPKIHLIRFAGVFAPHYKYRSEIVPKPKELSLVEALIESKTKPKSKSRVSWARLLKRVFNIDVTKCTKCSGQMKIIAAIEDPKVIKKILSHLGLPTKAPTPWSVRGPPDWFDEYRQFEDSQS